MKYKKIEIGDKYNKLTVLKLDHEKNYRKYWLCKCDCGNLTVVRDTSLKSRNTKSCGCFVTEKNFKRNKYVIINDKIIGYTTKGEAFFISTESEWVLKEYCWNMNKEGYLTTTKNKKTIFLHRLLKKPEFDKSMVVDHVDGNPKNNCLNNLRIVNQSQNCWNVKRKKYYGISKTKFGKFRVQLNYNMNKINLGNYDNLIEAIKIRDKWEANHERQRFFREEKLNHPP